MNPDVRQFGWKQFRFAVAALLLTAAVVKIFNVPEIFAGGGLLATKLRLVAVIGFEGAAATFLIIGNRYWSWLLTLTTFAVFVASAMYALATDQACNCFGEQFSPETMVVVDTVVLLLTVCFRPRDRGLASVSTVRQLTVTVIAGALFATLSALQHEALLRSEESRLMLADVRIGKPWPLDAQKHSKLKALETGRWMILVIDGECGPCRNLIAHHFSDPATHRQGERTAIFVFVGRSDPWQFQFDRVALDFSNNDFVSWPEFKPIVASPAVFIVVDGVVVDAAEGIQADSFIRSAWNSNE
jgi:hypothetical protein